MRIVKEAEERRNEILDKAMELFASKGYDNTSVADIMNLVGIAKGTLYYHFKSKEEILDGIIERMSSMLITRARSVAEDKTLPVNEKMLQALLALNVKNPDERAILTEVHKPQNALMHQKILQVIITDVTPILSMIIEEGNEKGIFHTEYPYESAELFITYGNVIFDDGFMKLTQEEMMKRVFAFINNLERVLGAEKDSMKYVLQMFEGSETEK